MERHSCAAQTVSHNDGELWVALCLARASRPRRVAGLARQVAFAAGLAQSLLFP
jgi:hypothetical protein